MNLVAGGLQMFGHRVFVGESRGEQEVRLLCLPARRSREA